MLDRRHKRGRCGRGSGDLPRHLRGVLHPGALAASPVSRAAVDLVHAASMVALAADRRVGRLTLTDALLEALFARVGAAAAPRPPRPGQPAAAAEAPRRARASAFNDVVVPLRFLFYRNGPSTLLTDAGARASAAPKGGAARSPKPAGGTCSPSGRSRALSAPLRPRHLEQLGRGRRGSSRVVGHPEIVAVGPVLDDLAVFDAEPVGLAHPFHHRCPLPLTGLPARLVSSALLRRVLTIEPGQVTERLRVRSAISA
jgi:hypothetical protein